jgi:hypothetical protein
VSSTTPVPPIAMLLALLSGALLTWAGYIAANGEINTALWVSLVPGVTIELAFGAIRRADRLIGRPRVDVRTRVAQLGAALVAGAFMAVAGFAFGKGMHIAAFALIVLGGVTVNAAMVLGRGPQVQNGRFTADIDGDFVVFLIGMRFNKMWKIHKWLLVVTAMGRMQRTLDAHPELGCLGYRQWNGLTTVMVSYWRDFESLDAFARAADLPHLEPWRKFNRLVRDSGDVGIWHETYRIAQGHYEGLYGNMPPFGLAAASRSVPIASKGQTAAARIGATKRDEPAIAPY